MKIGESIAVVFQFVVPIHLIGRCVASLWNFSCGWIRTRHWLRIVPASIPFAVIIVLAWSLVAHRLPWRRQEIVDNYKTAADRAVQSHDTAGYRLAFRRLLEMDGGSQNLRFEFASTLYDLGEHDEAMRMMAGMAPLQQRGYEPAHRFMLARLPAGESHQIHLIRAVHLSHIIGQNADARSERIELVKLLASYKNYDRAEEVLRPTLDKYPEDSLAIAQMKARSGEVQAARSEARHACEILRPIVASEPENVKRRIQLAQGHIFLAEPANALKVLLESLPESADTPVDSRLCEAMASTYSVWLSLMPRQQQDSERACLRRLAALPQLQILDEEAKSTSVDHVSTALDDKQLFASTIESSRRTIVVPFLRGTIAATEGDWPAAERSLRLALIQADRDPSINNNLACVLVNAAASIKDENARLTTIHEALRLSAQAIETSPDIAEFHETHAQVLALNGSHEQAVGEWKQCLAMGLSTRKIHLALAASLKLLGLISEASRYEQESRNSAF